jgi:hypothetical protein
MSIYSLELFLIIRKSRKFIWPLSSYVGFNCRCFFYLIDVFLDGVIAYVSCVVYYYNIVYVPPIVECDFFLYYTRYVDDIIILYDTRHISDNTIQKYINHKQKSAIKHN